MKTLKELVSGFQITDQERTMITLGGENSLEAPGSFKDIARAALSGHFEVRSGNTIIKVRPTSVEFYCHEEAEGGIKDWIVYHRSTGSSSPSLIPTGFLHNHVSGIDLTFEHNNGGPVRASILFREFRIEGSTEDSLKSLASFGMKEQLNDTHSTRMYPALFSEFSAFDGFEVKWIDGKERIEISAEPRQNVAEYDSNTQKKIEVSREDWKNDPINNFKYGSRYYRKCLRCWQFKPAE